MKHRNIYSLLLIAIMTTLFSCVIHAEKKEKTDMKYRDLTPEEERVIVYKGTEAPFSGKYDDFDEAGVYTCKRCGAPLYRSDAKFDSGCGWPSFDDEIDGAVKRVPDADGRRTEILCANCGAHLGHVFTGEGFTPKNTRHCVNSISMEFIPADKLDKNGMPVADKPEAVSQKEKAVFAGGCFWGVEYMFKEKDGVLDTTVGFAGGHVDDPTYKEVCREDTGHAEAVEIIFDPSIISFEELCRFFFEIHDPTQVDRQGPDVGEQYRSAVFFTSAEQKRIAEDLIAELKKKGFQVVTEVEPLEKFWPAEEYHQDYYEKTGHAPYCHRYVPRFD